MIARKADGGMRDALSLLDQVLSLTGGEVSADAVRRVLGLVEDERYLELLDILRTAGTETCSPSSRGWSTRGTTWSSSITADGLLRTLLRLRLRPRREARPPGGFPRRAPGARAGLRAGRSGAHAVAGGRAREPREPAVEARNPRGSWCEMLLLRLELIWTGRVSTSGGALA